MPPPRPWHARRPGLSRRPARLGLLALSFLLAGPALAQYQWKDATGQLHVSDLPPPREVLEKDILKRPGRSPGPVAARLSAPAASGPAAASPSRPASTAVDPELQARRQRAEAEARARAKADEDRTAAQRAENCQRARDQLALLDSGQRMVRLNAQGEREPVDDATRAAEADAARRVVASDCR